MTPEREKYLKSISWGERIGRWCIKECKDEIKKNKRDLNERKEVPLGYSWKPSDSKKMIKRYKQKLTKVKHILRRDTGHG